MGFSVFDHFVVVLIYSPPTAFVLVIIIIIIIIIIIGEREKDIWKRVKSNSPPL